jgi:hypothetical protein
VVFAAVVFSNFGQGQGRENPPDQMALP